jgi:hypothetical protein
MVSSEENEIALIGFWAATFCVEFFDQYFKILPFPFYYQTFFYKLIHLSLKFPHRLISHKDVAERNSCHPTIFHLFQLINFGQL